MREQLIEDAYATLLLERDKLRALLKELVAACKYMEPRTDDGCQGLDELLDEAEELL